MFFSDIGSGTQFVRLPLEVLKLIFQYKVIADYKLEKEQEKIRKIELKEEIRQERLKQLEENRARYKKILDEQRREHDKRIREEQNQQLRGRFGTSTFPTETYRRHNSRWRDG
jgi:hypothetical protein